MKNILILGVCMGASLHVFAQETTVVDTLAPEKKTIQKDVPAVPEAIDLFKPQSIPSPFAELGRVEIITREDIESSAVQTLSGVLSRVMNTSVQSSGPMNSLGQVYMRDGDANSVVILINGQRMNSMLRSIYTLDNIPVSLDMIDHIEVRTGGDSKHYGEFAIDGVINIITRNKAENTGVSVGAYGGNLSSYGGGVAGAYKRHRLDVIANVSGDRSSWEDQEYSNSKSYLHTQYKLLKWMNVFFDGSFVYNHYNMPFMFQRSQNNENMNTYSFRGTIGFDMPVGPRFNLFLKYSYSNFREQYDPYGYRDYPIDGPYAHQYLSQVVYSRYRNSAFNLGGIYRARMIDVYFGFDFNSDKFMSNDLRGSLLDKWIFVPGRQYSYYKYGSGFDSWRIYYNMSVKLKKWYLNMGVSVNSSSSFENAAFMYGGELGINLLTNLKVFAGYDRSFRNQTFFETYVENDLDKYKGNKSADNEFVNQWNVGVRYQNDYSSLEIIGYMQSTKNAIVAQLQTSAGYFQYANYSSDKIGTKGFEGRYRINLDKLTDRTIPITNLSVSYAYNKSDLKSVPSYTYLSNNYVQYNGKASASVRIMKNLFVDVDFALQKRNGFYLKDPDFNSGLEERADTMRYGWEPLLAARLMWKPQNNRYQIYVQGQNLLNKKYYNASFIPAQEMSIVAGVKYNFFVGRKKDSYYRKED